MNVPEQLRELIEQSRNILVIVEGIKDKKALKELGFRRIYTVKKPIYAVVEDILKLLQKTKTKECLILTDLDREGRKIYAKLNSQLSQNGVKVNNMLRNFLFRYTPLRQIEGLNTYIKTICRIKNFEHSPF